MTGDDMDVGEFHTRAETVLRRLLPKVPEDHVWGLESAMNAGEFGFAIEDMVDTVVNRRIPIGSDDLAELTLLAGAMKERDELLPMLERAAVESAE